MTEPQTANQDDTATQGDEVTAGEAAYILGVSVATLYRWRGEGQHTDKIGPYRYGKSGRLRYRKSELLLFKNDKTR